MEWFVVLTMVFGGGLAAFNTVAPEAYNQRFGLPEIAFTASEVKLAEHWHDKAVEYLDVEKTKIPRFYYWSNSWRSTIDELLDDSDKIVAYKIKISSRTRASNESLARALFHESVHIYGYKDPEVGIIEDDYFFKLESAA